MLNTFILKWKQEKFAETGKFDVLSAGWTKDMLHALWQSGLDGMGGKARRDADLRAEMHTLSIGGELAAIDLGLTDGKTFHSWIVAYNAEFHTLAPGIQLLEALIDEAAALGYTRIDLGEGLDGYKRHYASEDVNVHSGYVAASGAAAAITRLYGAAETLSEKHFGRIGRLPGKARRRYAQIQACEPRPARRALAMLAAAKGAPSQPR